MSENYTTVELRNLDDAAAAGGFGDNMEARFARKDLGLETVGVSLQRIKPGKRSAFAHHHERDEEVYVVIAGSGRALLGDELVELQPWTAVRVPPTTTRAFEAGDDGLEFLAFGAHSDDDQGEMGQVEWPE